jgi:hypothetical protein
MDQTTAMGAGAAGVWALATLGASAAFLGGEGGVAVVAAGFGLVTTVATFFVVRTASR